MDSELLKRAAVIRDETTEAANTANRVGSLLVDALTAVDGTKVDKKEGYGLASDRQRYVADWCDEHILTDNNAGVPFLTASDKGAEGYALSHCLDGNTYRTNAYIPLATDKASGIMSAADHADFSAAKEDIETLFESVAETDERVTANTSSIAENKTAIAANTSSIAENKTAIADNGKSVVQLSTSLVLPFGGTDALISSVEGTAYVSQWGTYGSLPVYASQLNLFVITAGMKRYAAWTHFADIPDSDKYGSTRVLFYDGTRLYRYTGKGLVEITADTTALEARVAALEATLAALTAETLVTI